MFAEDFTAAPADDTGFVIPASCPQEFEYTPGESTLYWDDNEAFQGWPQVKAVFDVTDRVTYEAIKQDYNNYISGGYSYGRCWFYWYNNETGAYELGSGIMQFPDQEGFNADWAEGFFVTFEKLNLHQTAHTLLDAFDVEGGATYYYGNTANYADNAWKL